MSDAALFRLVRTGSLPSEWEDFIRSRARRVDRSGHFADSNRAYAELIRQLRAGDADAATGQVERVGELFERRNPTTDYSCPDGGHKCGPNVVDYRLGAILHHYQAVFGKKYPPDKCPHAWVW